MYFFIKTAEFSARWQHWPDIHSMAYQGGRGPDWLPSRSLFKLKAASQCTF